MQLTYNEALASIIERTEIGYTLASQDKVWIVFTFDLDSDGEYASFRYNRLYPIGPGQGLTYEMMGLGRGPSADGCVVFTTRAEAEHYAMAWRNRLEAFDWTDEEKQVYVMNLGDNARYERTIIGPDGGARPRATPKFKGSEAAWAAMTEMTARWRAANSRA